MEAQVWIGVALKREGGTMLRGPDLNVYMLSAMSRQRL